MDGSRRGCGMSVPKGVGGRGQVRGPRAGSGGPQGPGRQGAREDLGGAAPVLRGCGENGAAGAPEQLRAPPRGLLPAAAAPRLLPDALRRDPGTNRHRSCRVAPAG